MIPSLEKISENLAGAWGLAFNEPDALEHFDLSERGFWQSFSAALLAGPFWIWWVLNQNKIITALADSQGVEFTEPQMGVYLAAELAAYVFYWILFPVAMLVVTHVLDVRDRFTSFIIARNWALLLVIIMLDMPLLVLFNFGIISATSLVILDYATLIVELFYLWIIARRVLGIAGYQAAVVVAIDFVLSLTILDLARAVYSS